MSRRLLMVHGGSDLYGSGLACAWVVEAARQDGWEVSVVLPRPGRLSERLASLGVECRWIDPVPLRAAGLSSIKGLVQPVRWLPNGRKLWRMAAAGRFDLVHVNTAPAIGGLLTVPRRSVPVLWSIHEILRFPRLALAAYEHLLQRSDLITACSHAAADQFHDEHIRSRTRVVYTGARIDPVSVDPVLAHPQLRLLVAGRLTWWKGHDVVVRCLPRLLQAGLDVTLDILGGSFESDRRQEALLRELVQELDLTDRVRLVGEVPSVLPYLAQSDIFLQPSRTAEPFGIALIEGLALGRVCIATRSGGPAEILTHAETGYLVDPDDVQGLADTIISVAAEPEVARRVAARGPALARSYSADRMAAQILDLYEELLK